jgi:hypothetical protein
MSLTNIQSNLLLMKSFTEIQTYFNSLTKEELLQYHNEISTIQNPNDFIIVKQIVEYCYGKIEIIHLQIFKLTYHFIDALIRQLEIKC